MKTAFVVEDGRTDREQIVRYLQTAGFAVVAAPSVEDARTKLGQQPQQPDVIFLDVILPGQSGFEFCRELKGSHETQAIPVVMCSTKGTDVDRTWGTMLGADDYLAKPITATDIQQVLQRLILLE
ncbi:MAG: response regulator transcription factor [Spirulinaceae cyanobacterium]